MFRFRHPVTGTDGNFFGFANWLANRVTDIAVTGLGFRAICRAANFTIFGFANRLAYGAANVSIACLIAWLSDRAANVFVTCLETWLLDCAADIAVARLIDGLANGVTLVAIARFVNVSRAGDRVLFGNLVVNSPAAIHHLLFVDGFTDLFIAGPAAALRGAVIPTGRTRL